MQRKRYLLLLLLFLVLLHEVTTCFPHFNCHFSSCSFLVFGYFCLKSCYLRWGYLPVRQWLVESLYDHFPSYSSSLKVKVVSCSSLCIPREAVFSHYKESFRSPNSHGWVLIFKSVTHASNLNGSNYAGLHIGKQNKTRLPKESLPPSLSCPVVLPPKQGSSTLSTRFSYQNLFISDFYLLLVSLSSIMTAATLLSLILLDYESTEKKLKLRAFPIIPSKDAIFCKLLLQIQRT